MDIQRLRNLTTGILHTEMEHIYEDLESVTGIMFYTHMLPKALYTIEPWLRENVPEECFWDGEFNPEDNGKYDLPQPTEADRKVMFERYYDQTSPLVG